MPRGDALRYVVCYDVRDDRRRIKVANCLLGYGARVQWSVFEMVLDRPLFDKLVHKLETLIDPATDRVSVYPLCSACAGKAAFLGERQRDCWPGEEIVYIV